MMNCDVHPVGKFQTNRHWRRRCCNLKKESVIVGKGPLCLEEICNVGKRTVSVILVVQVPEDRWRIFYRLILLFKYENKKDEIMNEKT